MATVSLEILKNYILSQGGVVSSQQIVRQFQPFLKDPKNKVHNKELFKSYLSTLTDYRHDESSNVRMLELKKAFKTDTTDSPRPQSPQTKENTTRNEAAKALYKDQLQPMRDAQRGKDVQRDSLVEQDALHGRDAHRDRLRDPLHQDNMSRERSKQREYQRDPQRSVHRVPASRECQREQERGGVRAHTPSSRAQFVQDKSPRGSSRKTAEERRSPAVSAQHSPAMRRHSPAVSAQHSPATQRHSPAVSAQHSPATQRHTPAVTPQQPPPSEDTQDNAVLTPTKADQPVIRNASINAINMFNRTAQQKKPAPIKVPTQLSEEGSVTDTLDSNAHEDLREEMESGCSNVPLEQGEKEWIVKSALGDCDTITRLLLTDKNLVYYRDFISGYTGLHWSCKLGRLDMAKVLLEAGSEVSIKSNSGHTPLHLAAQTGKSDLIKLILQYGGDKDIRDHKGKKPGHYLDTNAAEDLKNLLCVPDPRLNTENNPALRKFSKAQSVLGFDLDNHTPKRAQTINKAWKKYKQSFVTKKTKKEVTKIDSNKRDSTLNPRSDSKENQRYGKAQTLPAKQTAVYF